MRTIVPARQSIPVMFIVGSTIGLAGCGTTTKSTLLRSELTASPPIGPVHLPTTKDGVSFQGNFSLQANQYTSRPMGTPDLNRELPDPNRPIEIKTNYDSSKIDGAVHLTQDKWVLSGEGSIFLSKHFRLFLGLDGSSSNGFWAGAGFNGGNEWSFEVDAAMGTLIASRKEDWRIETTSGGAVSKTRDTSLNKKDSMTFSRFDFTFAKRSGGPIIGYQALNMPITKAPNGDEYSRWLHTATVGYSKEIGFGKLAAFLQATNTGASWSPSARVQYTLELGGETSDGN
jgi:hypothetical protein